MELEQVNNDTENDVIDTVDELDSCEDENFVIALDEKMDDLASLLVEKILSDSRFDKVLASLKETSHRTENRRSTKDEKDHPSRQFQKIRDLIDPNRKPLQLSQKVKFAQQYLNVIELIYTELQAELGEDFYKTDSSNDTYLEIIDRILNDQNDTVELLTRLERFVLILAYSATPAYMFDDESVEDLDEEPLEKVQKRITALGHELLYLFDNLKTIRVMNGGRYLSSHIQLFLKFMEDYKFLPDRYTRQERYLLNQDIYFEPLNELNHIVCDLKNAISKGEFDKQPTFQLSMSRRKKSFNDTVSGINAENFKIAVNKYSKKLQDAITYFKSYRSSSIALYRFKIFLSAENQKITLGQFKKFFSELNKKAARPEVGFKGYLNFFYFWDKDNDQWFQDIVLIIDSDTLLQVGESKLNGSIRNVRQEFEVYAAELLERRGSLIFENEKVHKIEVEPVPLMRHLGLPSQILIEVNDREGWSVFEKKILPFFVYQEFLELTDDEEIRSRFSRGTRKFDTEI